MMQSGYWIIPVHGDEADEDLAYAVHLECEKIGYLVSDFENGKPALVVRC